ncbi:hypothetical protein pb186bvf_012158 [Paramecium bursaria]
MQKLNDFFDKNNLRMHQTLWITYVHIFGMIGLNCSTNIYWYSSRSIQAQIIWHYLTIVGVTGGVHRLWSHKSYKASFVVRVYLMLAYTNCFQGSIWHWARDHRLHHKFSDTPLDPHDSQKGFWYCHVGWTLLKKSKQLVHEGQNIDVSDLKSDSVVMFQKKHYYKLAFLCAFIIPMISGSLISNRYIFNFLFLGLTKYMITLNATWCVNSVCHFWGSRPYNKNIEPRDNFFDGIIGIMNTQKIGGDLKINGGCSTLHVHLFGYVRSSVQQKQTKNYSQRATENCLYINFIKIRNILTIKKTIASIHQFVNSSIRQFVDSSIRQFVNSKFIFDILRNFSYDDEKQ